MNPRVSRSSALASKATGFPIARIGTKVAVGYRLDELPNDITRDHAGLVRAGARLRRRQDPALRLREVPGRRPDAHDPDEVGGRGDGDRPDVQGGVPEGAPRPRDRPSRLGARRHAGRRPAAGRVARDRAGGAPDAHARAHLPDQARAAARRLGRGDRGALAASIPGSCTRWRSWWRRKRSGADGRAGGQAVGRAAVGRGSGGSRRAPGGAPEDEAAGVLRPAAGRPVGRAGERDPGRAAPARASGRPTRRSTPARASSPRPRRTSTPATTRRTRPAPAATGRSSSWAAAPTASGRASSSTTAASAPRWRFRELGYRTVMVNSNPETVSTDFDISDALYFEPLTLEDVLEIVHVEQPIGVVVQLGGQTPLRLARGLEREGVPILGTSPEAIDLAEDRGRFEAHHPRARRGPAAVGRGLLGRRGGGGGGAGRLPGAGAPVVRARRPRDGDRATTTRRSGATSRGRRGWPPSTRC